MENQTTVPSVQKVSTNTFNRNFVESSGSGRVSSTLVDGEANVWTGILRKVVQLPNN